MLIDGYNFNSRLKVPYTPSVTSDQIALQVTVGEGYHTNFGFDPTKIRFTSAWGNVIPHYYEGIGTQCYKLWFRTRLVAGSASFVYIYFDPETAVTDTSNGANVFHFFDDFATNTPAGYNGAKWAVFGSGTTFGSGGMAITSGGVMLSNAAGNQLSLVNIVHKVPQSWPANFETINFNDGSFTIEAAVLAPDSAVANHSGALLLATNGCINVSNAATSDGDDGGNPAHHNSCLMMMVNNPANSKEIKAWSSVQGDTGYAADGTISSNVALSATNIWGIRQWDTGQSKSLNVYNPGWPFNYLFTLYSTYHRCEYKVSPLIGSDSPTTFVSDVGGPWTGTTATTSSPVWDNYHGRGPTFLALGLFASRYYPTSGIKPTTYKWVRVRKHASFTTALWDSATNPAIPAPHSISPANNSYLSPGPVTFNVSAPSMWAAYAAEGYTYSLSISKDGVGMTSVPMTMERPGIMTGTAFNISGASNYEWYAAVKKSGTVVAVSPSMVFTTKAEAVYPDVMFDNPWDAMDPISVNTARDVYTQTTDTRRLNSITAQVLNRSMQPLTENTIRIWLQNPVVEQLPMTPAGIASFPENVAITVSTLTSSTPGLVTGRLLDSCDYSIKESNNIIWWPVLSSIAPLLAGIDETNLSSTRYQKWDNRYYSLFTAKLIPNAINRIDIVYYTLQPGDYTYTNIDTSGLINFNRRTLYIPYYPNLKTDTAGVGYWLADAAPIITPAEGVNSADVAQLTAATPTIAESIVSGPGAVSQYRLSTAPLTKPTEYTYIGGGAWSSISRTAQPNILPVLKPNNYLYVEARLCYMDVTEDKAILGPAISSQTTSYMYAVPPRDARVYGYTDMCRIIADPTEATMTVYKTADMEKVRYYIWNLSGQATHPEIYLNTPHTGPFTACQLDDTGHIPEVPAAIYDTTAEMDTVTFVNDTIAEDTLIGWAAKPINGANNTSPDTDGPWAVNSWNAAVNMLYYGSTLQPTIIGPTGTVVNLAPWIEFVATAGSVYSFWLLKKVGELWEQVPGAQGTISVASAGLVKQEFLPAGFLLSNLTTYMLVLHDVGTDDRPAGCPAFSSFTTSIPPLSKITKIADADPVIVDRGESNIRRFAISVNHFGISTAVIASNSVAVTKAIGLPSATTAISVEAGAYFPPDTTNSITCEVQFNGDGYWHKIAPTSWPTTETPSTLFINQNFDQTVISDIEAEYGAGSVVTLADIAFSVRLRFTLLHPDAKLQRFITIKGIS